MFASFDWFSALLGALVGIAVATLLRLVKKWFVKFYRRRHGRMVGALCARFEELGFGPYPGPSWRLRPVQYLRRKVDGDMPVEVSYKELVGEEIEITEFRAFLIPDLDSGHFEKGRQIEMIRQGRPFYFDPDWGGYLDGIGRKANQARMRLAKQRRVRARDFPRVGRRIILFNKFLLDFFLTETRLVLEACDLLGPVPEGATGRRVSPHLRNLAELALRVAFYVERIHVLSYKWRRDIKFFYIDKSLLRSDQYYDFGLYVVKKKKIVFMPVFRKGLNKSIVEERVYYDFEKGHRNNVQSFEKDFEEIFEEYWALTGATEDAEWHYPEGKNYEKQHFSPDEFERGYRRELIERFREFNLPYSAQKDEDDVRQQEKDA